MWHTTVPSCAAMSAVNTGTFASFAFRTPGPIPLESTGQTMTASTLRGRNLQSADLFAEVELGGL